MQCLYWKSLDLKSLWILDEDYYTLTICLTPFVTGVNMDLIVYAKNHARNISEVKELLLSRKREKISSAT